MKLKSGHSELRFNVYEPVHENSNNMECATSKASDQPAHTRSLIRAIFLKIRFALLFLHTIESFGERTEHGIKEWNIPNQYSSLVLKNSVLALTGITVHYLHFALISMETEIL